MSPIELSWTAKNKEKRALLFKAETTSYIVLPLSLMRSHKIRTKNGTSARPAQLAEFSHSAFDPESFSHSAYVMFFVTVSSPSEHHPKTPAYASTQWSKRTYFRLIYFEEDSEHKHNQKWTHRNIYKNSPKRFVHEGCLEVLDEGVGGSLTKHLQEVCNQLQEVNKV